MKSPYFGYIAPCPSALNHQSELKGNVIFPGTEDSLVAGADFCAVEVFAESIFPFQHPTFITTCPTGRAGTANTPAVILARGDAAVERRLVQTDAAVVIVCLEVSRHQSQTDIRPGNVAAGCLLQAPSPTAQNRMQPTCCLQFPGGRGRAGPLYFGTMMRFHNIRLLLAFQLVTQFYGISAVDAMGSL